MTRAEELVALFDTFDGRYRREEMEEALGLREEITPLLLEILDNIVTDPVRYMAEEHHAETYAIALLAHFREKRAHLPIIRAFSIPDKQREFIWGDMLTETLPALLCRTAGSDYSHIMELIQNREAYEYLRSAGMEAIKLGIGCEVLSRKEGITLYASLFDEKLAVPEDYFWSSLVMNLLDLHPTELIGEVRELYARGFVFEGEVSLGNVEKEMDEGYEAAMVRLKQKITWSLPDDAHGYISWFACFRENEDSKYPVHDWPEIEPAPFMVDKKQKIKNRNKRKQAKASKRKNRK